MIETAATGQAMRAARAAEVARARAAAVGVASERAAEAAKAFTAALRGDSPPIWLELAVKYDVPEFGADPLPLPTFADAA